MSVVRSEQLQTSHSQFVIFLHCLRRFVDWIVALVGPVDGFWLKSILIFLGKHFLKADHKSVFQLLLAFHLSGVSVRLVRSLLVGLFDCLMGGFTVFAFLLIFPLYSLFSRWRRLLQIICLTSGHVGGLKMEVYGGNNWSVAETKTILNRIRIDVSVY